MTRRRVRLDWLAGLIVVAAAVAVAVAATSGSSGGSPPIAPRPIRRRACSRMPTCATSTGICGRRSYPTRAPRRARRPAIPSAPRGGRWSCTTVQRSDVPVAGMPAVVAAATRSPRRRADHDGLQRWSLAHRVGDRAGSGDRATVAPAGPASHVGRSQTAAASFALAYIDYAEGARRGAPAGPVGRGASDRRRPGSAQQHHAHPPARAAGAGPARHAVRRLGHRDRPVPRRRVRADVHVPARGGQARGGMSYLIPNSLGVRP